MTDRSLALIGVGRWGKNLARNFHLLGALHTLCDHHSEHLATFKAQFPEVTLSEQPREVFKNPKISKVVIAAPACQHYALAKEALLSGKDVFVEKPIAMNARDAEELVQIADENKRILMVGHLLHYHPVFVRLLEIVKKGELGEVHYVSSHRLSTGPVRPEENALWNFAPHDVSMLLELVGETPTVVKGTGGAFMNEGIEDIAMTTLSFPSGAQGHIFSSWLHPFKEHKLTVTGSKGMAVFDDTLPWEKKLEIISDPFGTCVRGFPVIEQKEPLQEECRHFLECCHSRKTPRTCGREGARVTEVLELADVSLRESCKIPLFNLV